MGKRNRTSDRGSHAAIKAAIHADGYTPPKRKRTVAAKQLALHGLNPHDRADRPSRRASGGKTDTVNVVVAPPRGIAPPMGLMQGPLAAPVGLTPKGGRIGIPKGLADRERVGGVSGSPSYANGGCVSRGSSLADIRRKTQP